RGRARHCRPTPETSQSNQNTARPRRARTSRRPRRPRRMDPTELEVATLLAPHASAKRRAPDFGGARAWFNVSRPLALDQDLRGKVVLVHFWTPSSIDCVHRLEDLRALEQEFAGAPVAVIGCHAPKLKRESEPDHARSAVLRLGIEHPVVLDQN